jgi:hypothetical protein
MALTPMVAAHPKLWPFGPDEHVGPLFAWLDEVVAHPAIRAALRITNRTIARIRNILDNGEVRYPECMFFDIAKQVM